MNRDECRRSILCLSSFLYKKAKDFQKKAFIAICRDGASKGNASAIGNLADCYMQGTSIAQDYTKAVLLYTQAAEKGNGSAMNELGKCYSLGLGVKANNSKSFKWFKRAVKNGSIEAIRLLATFYMHGIVVPEDKNKAIRHYIQASEKGDIHSMLKLGKCYEKGIGVEKKFNEAFKWYECAEKNGYTAALIKLGNYFEKGLGILQDYAKAFDFYLRAYKKGVVGASCWLGNCYMKGIGINKNYSKGIKFYLKAINNGSIYDSIEALLELSEFYQNSDNELAKNKIKQVIIFSQKAAEREDPGGMYFLGLCFEYGAFGTVQDTSDAIILYWKASEKGHQNAKSKLKELAATLKLEAVNLFDIALNYQIGFGVPEDHQLAAINYLEAAKKNYIPAMYKLANLYETGDGVIKDEEEAFTWYSKAEEAEAFEKLKDSNYSSLFHRLMTNK